ncbi:MAG: LLM class F420-dependent oxidoreductase [Solirubrobacterales bacterium]
MASPPTLGLFALNQGAVAREALERIGPLVEELGYDSLWVGEHVVVPDPRVKPSPMEPEDPILDGLVSLAFLAAHTERIGLATGIVILPQRNPLILAKQLASVDVLSDGRLVFGLGVGYLEPEMSAIGVEMERRGTRADEYLAAMRALWEQEKPSFEGDFVSFSGVNAHPRPIQRPLPVIVGGRTPAAHRRAVRHADGWYGYWLDLDRTAEQLDGIRAALGAAGRDESDFEITVTPRGRIDAGAVAAYDSLGVDRLVLIPPFASPLEEIEEFVREHAPGRIGARSLA